MDILERLKQWTPGRWPDRSLDDDLADAIAEIERLRGTSEAPQPWVPLYGYSEAVKMFGGEGQGVSGSDFIFQYNAKTGGIYAMALPPLPVTSYVPPKNEDVPPYCLNEYRTHCYICKERGHCIAHAER